MISILVRVSPSSGPLEPLLSLDLNFVRLLCFSQTSQWLVLPLALGAEVLNPEVQSELEELMQIESKMHEVSCPS